MTDGTTAVLLPARIADDRFNQTDFAVMGWLASYGGVTRRTYSTEIRLFRDWLRANGIDLLDVGRTHVELYARWCGEIHDNKRSTVNHKIAVLASFYIWCFLERVVPENPCAHLRRPRIEYISTREGMDRMEAMRFMAQAKLAGGRTEALCTLLLLNGLRISEALGADLEDLGEDKGHRTLKITRKGGREARIPLSATTHRAILAYTGERTTGPIFLAGYEDNQSGRMTQCQARRIVAHISQRAEIAKHITCHSLRHSFITAALDAGVPLRDVQNSAGHQSPATTSWYDRNRDSLDRHATHIVTAFLAGG